MPAAFSPLDPLLADHRHAVAEYVGAARRLDDAAWLAPLGPGKWSPARLTEHVVLAIELATDEVANRGGMALRLSAGRRFLLRCFVLPRVLRTGRFPDRAPAPRETRPAEASAPRSDILARLERAVAALEEAIRAVPDIGRRRVTHPYFGRLPCPTGLRLLTVHARHHLAQLPRPVPTEHGSGAAN